MTLDPITTQQLTSTSVAEDSAQGRLIGTYRYHRTGSSEAIEYAVIASDAGYVVSFSSGGDSTVVELVNATTDEEATEDAHERVEAETTPEPA